MLVTTVIAPSGLAASFVHVTVIETGWLRTVGVAVQVWSKATLAGVAVLVTFQTWSEPWVAVMSLRSPWGRISLTGIETSLEPIPAVPKASLARLACSDEPGYRCDPRARRP